MHGKSQVSNFRKHSSFQLTLRSLGFGQSVQQFHYSKGKMGNASKRYTCAKLPGKVKYRKRLKAIFSLFLKGEDSHMKVSKPHFDHTRLKKAELAEDKLKSKPWGMQIILIPCMTLCIQHKLMLRRSLVPALHLPQTSMDPLWGTEMAFLRPSRNML